ncbi:MAG TPA: hypothetical protein VM388_06085 [Acidimicrobiales bacterium]|nr:hypothetical protein [Acidimicrobiales bacterium]
MRPPLALLAGATVALVAAAVLGEYDFDGWAVIGSGLLVGLFVAEAVVIVARGGSPLRAVTSAGLAAGALLWAGWTSTGHRLGTVSWKGWAAVVLAAVAAAVRARPTAAAQHTPPAPASAE